MRYAIELLAIDDEIINAIEAEWLPYLRENSDDIPVTHYRRIVDWAGRVAQKEVSDPNTYVYALTSNDSDTPKVLALLDVVYKHPTIHDQFCIKIIGVHSAPHYDLRQQDTTHSNTFTRTQTLAVIASHLIVQGLDLVIKENAVELKIYASNQVTLDMFTGANTTSLQEALQKASVSVDKHGNWIVFGLK